MRPQRPRTLMQSTMSSVASLARPSAATAHRSRVARPHRRNPRALERRAGRSEGDEASSSRSSDVPNWKRGARVLPRGRGRGSIVNLGPAAMPAAAIYNKDLDVPINDPEQALAVVFGVKDSIKNVQDQLVDWKDTCPAPTFPCDLSQALNKTSTRVSGPAGGSLPTLSDAYGADPYAVQDIIQSVSTSEAMLKANNARVKVDFDGPAEYLAFVDTSHHQPAERSVPGRGGGWEEEECDSSICRCRPGRWRPRVQARAGGVRRGGVGRHRVMDASSSAVIAHARVL